MFLFNWPKTALKLFNSVVCLQNPPVSISLLKSTVLQAKRVFCAILHVSAGVTANPIPPKLDPGQIQYASGFNPTLRNSIKAMNYDAIELPLTTSQ